MSLSYRLTQDVSCTIQITSISAPVIQHYEKWYAVVHTKQMKCINKNCIKNDWNSATHMGYKHA